MSSNRDQHADRTGRRDAAAALDGPLTPEVVDELPPADDRGRGRAGRPADQADPHRVDGARAARRGPPRAARRRGPPVAEGDPRALDPRARGDPLRRPAPGARRGDAAVHAATTPSERELRIAQAQLVGWLEGLFHGIQATLFTQQMQAQRQFEEMRQRRALELGAARRPTAARRVPLRRRRA